MRGTLRSHENITEPLTNTRQRTATRPLVRVGNAGPRNHSRAAEPLNPSIRDLDGFSDGSSASSDCVSGRRRYRRGLCRVRCRSDKSRWSILPRDESCRAPCTPGTSPARLLLALRPSPRHLCCCLHPARGLREPARAVATRAGNSACLDWLSAPSATSPRRAPGSSATLRRCRCRCGRF
jgi:hypothetical protein